MRLFGTVVEGLGNVLSLYNARHRVLTENIANVETPGYRARDLDFGEALAQAFTPPVKRPGESGANAIALDAITAPQAEVDREAKIKIDGNSVDVDVEMAKLSENALRITALAQIISRKYAGLRAAIDGGRS